MFSMKNFVKKGLLDAVGKRPDYWVILNATGWLEKGVLDEADLEEINTAIDAKNAAETEETEEATEETEEATEETATETEEATEETTEEE